MRIARVFPTKTSMSPTDRDAYFGEPELFMPEYDEIHISVAFTWDIKRAQWLAKQWEFIAPVKIGGPAMNGEGDGFVPGQYLRHSVTITSRGCPNRCPFCFINKPLREIDPIPEGNIIQDNNLLACSRSHTDKVFQMLSRQHSIIFPGGLEAGRIKYDIVEHLRGLRLKELWTAYDQKSDLSDLMKASYLLRKYFKRVKLRCYVLIGYGDDTIENAETRMMQAFDLGFLPFAMLYRNREGEYPKPEKEWRQFQRTWTRPAAIMTRAKEIEGISS